MIKTLLIGWVVITSIVLIALVMYIIREVLFVPDYMYYSSDPRDDIELKFNWKFDDFYEQKPVYDKTDDMIYSLYERED